MVGPLGTIALVAAAVAALFGWGLAWRYGWQRALVLPLLAVGGLIFVAVDARDMGLQAGMSHFASSLIFVAPVMVGSLLGIVLASRRKR